MKLYFTEAQGKVNSDECANISVIALDSTISSCVLKTLQEVKYGKRQLNGPKRMMEVNSVPDDWVSPGVEAFVAVIGSVWSALSSWSEQSGLWQITLPRRQACWVRPDLTVPDMSPHSSLHVTACFCLYVWEFRVCWQVNQSQVLPVWWAGFF